MQEQGQESFKLKGLLEVSSDIVEVQRDMKNDEWGLFGLCKNNQPLK